MPRRPTAASRAQVPPPDGQLRQSQAATSFGPGAMLDLLDDAVLVSGLNFWQWTGNPAGSRILREPRLREQLDEYFRALGQPLSVDEAFREPPAGDDRQRTKSCGIPVFEFPRWFVCQEAGCRRLIQAQALARKGKRYVHTSDGTDRKDHSMVPVRFVVACPNGHLEDFPWKRFVHEAKSDCGAMRMRLSEGATGDFAEVEVLCETCGSRRRLIDAQVEGRLPKCRGERPWLGPEGREDGCMEHLRLLVRTASNTYFPQVMSALHIPERPTVRDAVQANWGTLQAATPQLLPAFRAIPAIRDALRAYGDGEVLAAVADIREGRGTSRLALRTAEFREICKAKAERRGELPGEDEADFAARSLPRDPALPAGIERVILLHKLREVRAQVGFTRIEAASPDLQGEFDLRVRPARLGLQTSWLPATEIRGEGVFLQLDEAKVRAWEESGPVRDRARELSSGHEAWLRRQPGGAPFPGARFYLIHSLAHLLINAVSLECGYPASAIRERVYCAPATDPTPMAALLLSTGSSGAEGTLGGLVEQGRALARHLEFAIDLGRLCSNDPVCAMHSPRADFGERHLEGAACHGCLFVAECSCERFNHYLDRALVVPTIGHEAAAFFG